MAQITNRLTKYTQIYVIDTESATGNSNYYKRNGHTNILMLNLFELKTKKKVWDGVNFDGLFEYLISTNKLTNIMWIHNLSWDGDFLIKYMYKQKFSWLDRKLGFELDMEEKFDKDNHWSFFKQGSQIYEIRIAVNIKGRKFRFVFKCSANMLSAPVAALGKDFGISKEDDDMYELIMKYYPHVKTKEQAEINMNLFYDLLDDKEHCPKDIWDVFMDYMDRDTYIVCVALEQFLEDIKGFTGMEFVAEHPKTKELYTDYINPLKKMTIGSIAYQMMKNWVTGLDPYYGDFNFNKEIRDNFEITHSDYQRFAPYYYGGWTQANASIIGEGWQNKKGSYWDINSSYPWQMSKLMPYGGFLKEKPKYGMSLKWIEVKIHTAIIKRKFYDIPILKNWKKRDQPDEASIERYCRELSNATAFYLEGEWNLIKEWYDIDYTITNVWYTKAERFLKDWVEPIYNNKKKHSMAGHKALALTPKITLNSGYGQNCKRDKWNSIAYTTVELGRFKSFRKNETIFDFPVSRNSKGEPKMTKVQVDSVAKDPFFKYNKISFKDIKIKKGKKYPNKLRGAAITSYARQQLWGFILAVGPENFIYSDTDSVIVALSAKEVKDKLQMMYDKCKDTHIDYRHNFITDKYKLGAWSLETEFDDFRTMGAKRYQYRKGDKIVDRFGGVKISRLDRETKQKLFTDGSIIIGGNLKKKADEYGLILWPAPVTIKKGTH